MKKALIVFPDEWIAYSPTILNLYECLKADYCTKIITFQYPYIKNEVEVEDIEFIPISKWKLRALRKLKRYRHYKLDKLTKCLRKESRKQYDLVIAVDAIGFLACCEYFVDPVFLSLEVREDEFIEKALKKGIRHLIIQSKERKDFLLGKEATAKVSYIQNAPILHSEIFPRESSNKRLVYFGNIKEYYGIENCIEALKLLGNDYTLTLKGIKDENYHSRLISKYKELTDSGKLIIDHSYIDQKEVIAYLRDFDIGFAMFDFSYIQKDLFNFLSTPSGKIFNYFAAGVPVIGNDIIGFSCVKDYGAGILLPELSAGKIAEAAEKIHAAYEPYSVNCIRAAKDFDFKKGFEQFIKNLNE